MTTRRTLILETLKAHGGRLPYRRLREETGIPDNGFSAFVHHLTKEALIHSEGTRLKRVIILSPVDTPRPKPRTPPPSAPEQQPKEQRCKERRCLKCREPFMSSWPGDRTCRTCKITNANTYGPRIHSLPYGTGRG